MGKSIKRVDGDILMSDPTEEKVRPVKKEIESLPKDKETSDLTEEMINSVCIEEDSVFVHNISKGTLHVGFVDPKDKLKVLEIELNDYVSVSKKLFKTCEPLRKCLKKNLITIISKERAKKLDDRKALREKSKEDKDKSQESTTLPYKQVLNLRYYLLF